MRMLLIFAVLAGIAYLVFKTVVRGAPSGTLSSIMSVPGAQISKLSFHGGSLGTIAIVLGAAFLVIILAYSALAHK